MNHNRMCQLKEALKFFLFLDGHYAFEILRQDELFKIFASHWFLFVSFFLLRTVIHLHQVVAWRLIKATSVESRVVESGILPALMADFKLVGSKPWSLLGWADRWCFRWDWLDRRKLEDQAGPSVLVSELSTVCVNFPRELRCLTAEWLSRGFESRRHNVWITD